MGKFEEYDLYVRNKDFLISDRIITFSDTNGKLLALKPDVTLSIIKNGEDTACCKQKVYYNENVYRVSGSTHQYKEIMQTGLECIGDIDTYDIFEAVSLAAGSLQLISEDFVLDVSHLGVLSALLDESSEDDNFRKEAAHCIAEKNTHDLMRVCADYGVDADKAARLRDFVGIYGDMQTVIAQLEPLCVSPAAAQALTELRQLYTLLADTPYADRISFDFSIVNDMNYYNGIVFKGFLSGICEGVLAGGQYDKLMRKMGRKSGAVGFALYLDLLEDLQGTQREYDVDVLVLYDETTALKVLAERVNALTADGKSVTAQRAVPEALRYRGVCDMREGRNDD
jgi:ATP phosphoribosyltransferase regulatory subunit